MEKEKQIEEMAEALCRLIKDGDIKGCESCYFRHDGYECTCKYRKYAIQVHDAGYGNVKEAVKEFAKKLKKRVEEAKTDIVPEGCDMYFENGAICCEVIIFLKMDELIKEVCGD